MVRPYESRMNIEDPEKKKAKDASQFKLLTNILNMEDIYIT